MPTQQAAGIQFPGKALEELGARETKVKRTLQQYSRNFARIPQKD
jgi:hypothetical protein